MSSKSEPPEPLNDSSVPNTDVAGSNGGIYDGGLAAYRTVSEEEYRRLFMNGMITLDANALLNLYRYHPATRGDLLNLLKQLKARVWIAHHAMREFFDSRTGVIDSQSKELENTIAKLRKSEAEFQTSINTWANRAGLPEQQLAELTGITGSAVEKVIAKLGELGADEAFKDADDTAEDPVIAELASILETSVGPPLPETELLAAKEVARERIASKVPPGWKDANKPVNREGDYLVWYETLREAKVRGLDVLFITGDVKEDWWYRSKGEAKGPLPELVAEMKAKAGVSLYMLRPASFLKHASQILNVSVSADSVQDAERVSSQFRTYNQPYAEPVRIGDVWEALGDIWNNENPSGFRPKSAQAALGTVYIHGPNDIKARIPNIGFLDWGIASDDLLVALRSWDVYPVASGDYPVPPDVDQENALTPRGSVEWD
ncbi:MAG TPA: PIN-like domain-containing protein [Actinospica sp.]|nr:PIN-like domain-containing protein [Actinospica sp.]